MKKIFILLVLLVVVKAGNAQWQQTSLNSYTILSLATSGNYIFAGTNGHGVYMSSDNGNTWTPENNGFNTPNDEVWALTISGNYIYAGTSGNGIYVSTNNGNSWSCLHSIFHSNFGNTPTVSSILVKGDTIFAGTPAGVFFSTITDTTWHAVNNGLPGGVNILCIKGNNIFGGTWGEGVYLFSNSGSNWTQMNMGLTDSLCNAFTVYGNDIFVSTDQGGIFRSANNGSSWNTANSGLSPSNPVMAFAISGNNIFAATNGVGVFVSQNNGNTWQALNNGLTNFSFNALSVKGDTLFAGCWNGGVWKRSISEILQGGCNAQFIMNPDSAMQHHYYAVNYASGAQPLNYLWTWGDGTSDTSALPSHVYSIVGLYNICLTIIDNIGCTSTFCDSSYLDKSTNTVLSVDVVYPGFLGINETNNLANISIFPNPSNGFINISFSETNKEFKVDVLNSFGQLILTKDIINRSLTTLDLSNQAKGMYFIKVRSGSGVVVRKVVISE